MTDDNFPPLPRPWECGLCGSPPGYTVEHMREYARAAVEAALAAAPACPHIRSSGPPERTTNWCAVAAAPQAEPDHDVQALRQALWDVFAELGGDTDGNPTPESVTHGLISSAVTLARKHRQRRDALLDERDALREAARMALEAADSVVSQLSALHRATMGYEDACVLRGAELVADALREALGDEK